MTKTKKIISSLLFFIGGFNLGIIIFFPWEILTNLINSKSEVMHVSSTSFSPPLGIKLENVTIKTNDKNQYKIEKIKIFPSIFSPIYIIFGKISTKIQIETPESDATLKIKILKREKKLVPYFIELSGDIGINDIMKLIQLEGKGKMKVNAKIKGEIENLQKLNGEIRITSDEKDKNIIAILKNTEKIHIPVEGEFDLGKINIYATIKEGILNIENAKMQGGNIEGTISGSLKLDKTLQNSQLNITIDLKTKILNIPPQKLKIKGTISNPQLD